uniref:Uncharacterized protein n=1 Tax=Anguilla anguilla TaxID=7936 RepID=A0A0E9R064_ANGAN
MSALNKRSTAYFWDITSLRRASQSS